MHLNQTEINHVLIHSAGFVAQKRLSRGLKLNLSEAISLLTSQAYEFIRDGEQDNETLESNVRRLLGFRQVLYGVPELIKDFIIEAPFADGIRLIKVNDPICAPDGDLELALQGSYLPVPAYEVFGAITDDVENTIVPGNIILKDDQVIELNPDMATSSFLTVSNVGDSTISVGSHFNFVEANKSLVFDRGAAFGMRLNIPAGDVLSFLPGERKEVPLVQIGGQKIIKGGNLVCDGPVDDNSLRKTLKNVKKRGFGYRKDDNPDDRCSLSQLPRELYVQIYGPTTGDKIVLGDTCLTIEIERDMTTYGDECVFGLGKVLREGMGQMTNARNDVALDLVLTGAILIDPVLGVLKTDIGIRDGLIQNIGKSGSSHTMSSVSTGLIIGVGTDVIPAHGLIVTPGAVAINLQFHSVEQISSTILNNGITTAFVTGASGSVTSTTAGPNAVKQALQTLDDIPINTGILAKANTSRSEGLAREVEDCLVAGAGGLCVNESWGCTSAVLDTSIRLADFHDVPLLCTVDRMRECYNPNEILSLSKQRLMIIPYYKDLPSEVLKHPSVILTTTPRYSYEPEGCYMLDRLSEEVLHDVGTISILSCGDSDRQNFDANFVKSIWQIAHRMKTLRGPLPEETTDSDNYRVMRYLSKYTINPALALGCEHAVGTVQNNRLADLTVWEPGLFGVKPKYIIKAGQIMAMDTILTNQPSRGIGKHPSNIVKSMGWCGKSPTCNSLAFMSKAALEIGLTNSYAIQKHQSMIKNCRTLNRSSMTLNCTSPKLTVDEQMGKIYIDIPGRRETFSVNDLQRLCSTSEVNPLSQRYELI